MYFILQRPQEETKRLAKFLNIEASDKLIADIVEKCSFENMKVADKTIKDQSYMDKIIDVGEVARSSQPVMYRKGRNSYTFMCKFIVINTYISC